MDENEDEGSDDDIIIQKGRKIRMDSSSSDELMGEEERLKKQARKLNIPLDDLHAAYIQQKARELEKEKAAETEKLLSKLKADVESEAEKKGTDALKIQEQVMKQGALNLKEKDEQIKFIQKFISSRRFPVKIIKVTPKFFKVQQARNNLELIRENKNTIDIVSLSKLKTTLGFSEICELYTCMQNSSTTHKPSLLKLLDKIISGLNEAEKTLKLPISHLQTELKGSFISSSRKMAKRTTKEEQLEQVKMLQKMSFLPDCQGTNHILPAGAHFMPGKVIRTPEFGMFYMDPITKQSFQRASEISIAKTEHLAAVRFIGRASNADEEFLKLIDEELKLRMAQDTSNTYVKIKQEYEDVML